MTSAAERKTKEQPVPHLEIERKFLLDSLPNNLQQYPSIEIRQGYLVTDGTEIRIRQEGDQYFQTVKKGEGISRIEENIELTKADFERLWALVQGKPIHKTRYKIPTGEYIFELDIFHDSLAGHITVEVEFPSILEAEKFVPPLWFGRDVSVDPNYRNSALAKNGLPKDPDRVDATTPDLVLEESISKMFGMIEQLQATKNTPILVMLSGRTSAGKTSVVSDRITKRYGTNAQIFSLDNYSRGNKFVEEMKAGGQECNWDHPSYMDFEKIKRDLAKLKQGSAIDMPIFDFKIGEQNGDQVFSPSRIIVVEGLFALHPELVGMGDLNLFVDISLHGSIVRRLLRDIKRTSMDPASILRYYLEVVEPMYQQWVLPTKNSANLVLLNEYNPVNEAHKATGNEVQIKYRKTVKPETLQAVGANFLGQVVQTDSYFSSPNNNPNETLRIRKQGTSIILSYKGPKQGKDIRIRPKLEFAIDTDIKDLLTLHYGSIVTKISKLRFIYELDGIIVYCDDVWRYVDGDNHFLGSFTEISSPQAANSKQNIEKIAQKLGLDSSLSTTLTYPEIGFGIK